MSPPSSPRNLTLQDPTNVIMPSEEHANIYNHDDDQMYSAPHVPMISLLSHIPGSKAMKYAAYRHMLSEHVSRDIIEKKMRDDGLQSTEVDRFFKAVDSNHSMPSSSPHVTSSSKPASPYSPSTQPTDGNSFFSALLRERKKSARKEEEIEQSKRTAIDIQHDRMKTNHVSRIGTYFFASGNKPMLSVHQPAAISSSSGH